MMETIFILATEAHEESGGFGLETIFEANLVNLALLVGVLLYFAPKVLGNLLAERKAKIAEAIQEAEARAKKGAEALADQQQKLTQAQTEAERIRKAAEERAKTAKAAIAAQTAADIERLKTTAAKDLSTEQEKVMAELKARIIADALSRAESRLKTELDDGKKAQMVERSLAQLGG